MKWQRITKKYTDGHALYLGKWKVGMVTNDGTVSKGDPLRYQAACFLPGLNKRQGNFSTMDEAKSRVERVVRHWIRFMEETDDTTV